MDKTSIETGSGPEEQSQNTPSRTLAELEAIIKDVVDGLPKYQAMGLALEEIRSRKLYKEGKYKSFGSYLEEHWKISRAHGYRLIAAAQVTKMSPIGGKKPGNEHQARKQLASAKGKNQPAKKAAVILDPEAEKKAEVAADLVVTPSVLLNPEAEFEFFKKLVRRWENGLSNPAYIELLNRVELYLDNIIAEKTEVAA
jgi:hypothetical protein